MSQGIQAKAFTHGSDIYFNQGQYQPESSEGKKLLTHELTHVVQQQSAPQLKPEVAAARKSGADSPTIPALQRAELSMPFWVPIHPAKPRAMTGTDIHKEILADAEKTAKLETEAPVPNAIRSAHGLNLAGSADLYKPKPG